LPNINGFPIDRKAHESKSVKRNTTFDNGRYKLNPKSQGHQRVEAESIAPFSMIPMAPVSKYINPMFESVVGKHFKNETDTLGPPSVIPIRGKPMKTSNYPRRHSVNSFSDSYKNKEIHAYPRINEEEKEGKWKGADGPPSIIPVKNMRINTKPANFSRRHSMNSSSTSSKNEEETSMNRRHSSGGNPRIMESEEEGQFRGIDDTGCNVQRHQRQYFNDKSKEIQQFEKPRQFFKDEPNNEYDRKSKAMSSQKYQPRCSTSQDLVSKGQLREGGKKRGCLTKPLIKVENEMNGMRDQLRRFFLRNGDRRHSNGSGSKRASQDGEESLRSSRDSLPTCESFPKELLFIIRLLPGNNCCCDCGKASDPGCIDIPWTKTKKTFKDLEKKPLMWASVTYGTLLCDDCAFRHITKGDEVSLV
jgi:hypothetical protein